METRMKLSELTYEWLQAIGIETPHLRVEAEDKLRRIFCAEDLEGAKAELADKYGDIYIIVNPDEAWFAQIKNDDAKFKADFDKFCKEKAAWCARYGCN